MKTNVFFVRSCALILMSTGWLRAAEVASPSNLFPSPTGIYRNDATANVIYGATVQIRLDHCHPADRSAPPPTGTSAGTYVCGTTSHFRVVSGGSTTPVFVSAPVEMTYRLTPSAMGVPGVFDLEVLALTATGLPGGLMIRESPTLLSTGQHTIRQVPSGNYYISSFFDVFTEISSDGGMIWTPGDAAVHLELTEPEMLVATENQLPPAGSVMIEPTKVEFPNLVQVSDLQLKPSPAFITSLPLKGKLYQTDERGKATGQVSLDGGVTFVPFSCDYTVTKKMLGAPKIGEATAFYTQELLALDLSGGTLPSGLRIREAPTKASLGRASSRRAADGLYRISSFFDIFTECSLNNGATWSPNDGSPCYIVNSHSTPGVDVAAFGFNPIEVTSTTARPQPSPHRLELMSRFENGDIPTQEDLIEYSTGTIIRGLSLSLPSSAVKPPALGSPPVTQNIGITVQCEVSSDGGVTYEPVHGTATASVRINAVAVGAGASAALVRHEIEWLALDFSTTLSSGGTLRVRESPTKASLGRSAMRAAPDGTWMISSFFDVFTEISLDNGVSWTEPRPVLCVPVCHFRTTQVTGSSVGPIKWMAPESLREQLTPTSDYPPAGSVLACPSDIYAPNGVVLRRVKVHSIHNGSNLPPPLSSKTFTFTTTASGELSTDGGATFTEWVGTCTGSIGLTDFLDDDSDGDGVEDVRFFNGELLALDLSGGGLGAVRVRESPTKASLGRTSLRTTPSNSFGTLSFFDVFTEISIDNGTTWTPSSGLPAGFGFTAPPREYVIPTVSVPLAGAMESRDDAIYSNGVVMKPKRSKNYRRVLLQQGRYALGSQSQDVSFGLEMEMDVSLDGGTTFTPVQTIATCEATISGSVLDGDRDIVPTRFDCEFVVGTTTVKVRESPSLPSLGRLSKHIYKQVGTKFDVDSPRVAQFFDIFTEISLDGGIIWSPQSNRLHLDWQPVVEQDNAFATGFFPPRDGAFSQEAGAPPVLYGTNAIIRDMTLDTFETAQPLSGTSGARTIGCRCQCRASFDGGQTWTSITVPASYTFTVTPTTIEDKYDFEVTALSLVGATFMLRESPTLPSRGQTSVRTKPPGYVANGTIIDSFFDIFTEISLDGGATWTPAEEACRLRAERVAMDVSCDGIWSTQARATHRAVDPDYVLHFEGTDATLSGLEIGPATTIEPDGPAPAAFSGEINKRTCSCPAGYYVTSSAATPPRRQISFGWLLWTEQNRSSSSSTQLDTDIELSGLNLTTDVPGLLVRESPTRASTGRTSLRTLPGGYALQSFFDIFLELSLDGGQTWHAAVTPLKMEAIDATRPKTIASRSTDPLPPFFTAKRKSIGTYFETGDKPTQLQFGALIDSSLNLADDRNLIGLREYDASIEYIPGDTGVTSRARGRAIIGSDMVIVIGGLDVDSRTVYDIEITQFDMSGGTMPAGMKFRESPTLPSRGQIVREPAADGLYRTLSFFDVFLEISHDNGATWSASDLPLHFEQDERTFSSLTHSDHFVPQGINYIQNPKPVRCPDGSCAATLCDFTTPPAPLPNTPVVAQPFALSGHLTSSFTRTGASSVPVSADVSADVNLTLVETTGGTRHFDAEVISLTLTGTVSPAEFRLRESPTKASLGRHVVTDMGGGDFRITSFFDIFTEISVDGGQTWSECDAPMRLDLGGPELDVKLEPSTELVAGSSTIDFGYMLTGSTATRNVLLSNHGNIVLSDFGMSKLGSHPADFTFSMPSSTTLAPGSTLTVPITFTAGAPGTRTATVRITSSDADESPFDITLTARALAPTGDDDGDGLTNQQEMNITTNPLYSQDNPVTNPLHDDKDRLAFYRDNGLFLASDVQALNMDVPLLQKLPGTNQFKLIFGVQKSTDLIHFDPFPLSAPQSTINSEGKLEFLFTVPDSTSFFRVQAP